MPDTRYREQIDRLIAERSGELVLNGSQIHAAIIIERMFAHAEKNVSILSRRYDPRIYAASGTIEQAGIFLSDRSKLVRILLEEFDPEYWDTHHFFSEFKYRENVKVKLIPRQLHETITFNFATMDDYGYRFEEDKEKPVAIASFGDERFTTELGSIFDQLWERSEDVTPPEQARELHTLDHAEN